MAAGTRSGRSMPNEATTAVTLAIRSKDVSQAAGLIDAGFPADHVNIKGESLLHFHRIERGHARDGTYAHRP